ncbi:hypothetical protein D3105_25775 [Streptomyces globisporus]|uniref:Uncharacterized protein n=1 Tax=Streptomyces globisporus TaxID=1908 RepID=A0A423UTU7_STRGL|nr:hypothetical protein D3105_25775 [Streptomyces globisporus]
MCGSDGLAAAASADRRSAPATRSATNLGGSAGCPAATGRASASSRQTRSAVAVALVWPAMSRSAVRTGGSCRASSASSAGVASGLDARLAATRVPCRTAMVRSCDSFTS